MFQASKASQERIQYQIMQYYHNFKSLSFYQEQLMSMLHEESYFPIIIQSIKA